MKRGALTKETSKLINIWVPDALLPEIDRAIVREDTDRAKYIRKAIREKLARAGVEMQEAAR